MDVLSWLSLQGSAKIYFLYSSSCHFRFSLTRLNCFFSFYFLLFSLCIFLLRKFNRRKKLQIKGWIFESGTWWFKVVKVHFWGRFDSRAWNWHKFFICSIHIRFRNFSISHSLILYLSVTKRQTASTLVSFHSPSKILIRHNSFINRFHPKVTLHTLCLKFQKLITIHSESYR